MKMLVFLVAASLGASLLGSGCGSDDSAGGSDEQGSPSSSTPERTTANGGRGDEAAKAPKSGGGEEGDGVRSGDGQSAGGGKTTAGDTTAGKTKPDVRVPSGAPPKKLTVKEIEAGTGAVARRGDEVVIKYVGVDYASGKQFDSSWGRDELFEITLGAGEAVPGFERGIEGMREGGRRRLIVPPRLAYGAAGAPPRIPRSATLAIVVDLFEVK